MLLVVSFLVVLLLPVGLLLLLLLLVAVVVGLVRHHLLTFGAFPFRALAFLIRFLAPPSAHARGCRAQQPLAHVQAGRVDVAPTAPALADETISASRRPRVPFLWCVALWPSRRLCATLRFCVALWPIAAAGRQATRASSRHELLGAMNFAVRLQPAALHVLGTRTVHRARAQATTALRAHAGRCSLHAGVLRSPSTTDPCLTKVVL